MLVEIGLILLGAAALVAVVFHLGTRVGRADRCADDDDDWDLDATDNGCICGPFDCDPRCPACLGTGERRLLN
jgi:hypothetical protein